MIKSSTLDSQTDRQPTTNNHPPSLTKEESSKLNHCRSRVQAGTTEIPNSALPTPHSEVALVPKVDRVTTINSQPSTISLPAAAPARKIRRNGRIASLPRLQRDMVNHMLWNAVPYKNIVAALDEADYTVTERNISSWATGGYLEWSLAQEHVLENRLDQDHMLDFLRRDDAPELPEVGLQAAATRLSQVLLQKLARADDPEAQLDNYSKLVDLLVRLNREIAVTQKQRDDSRRTLGHEYDPTRVKETEEISAIENERFYSNPPSDSTLSKPPVPPALPPIPTAHILAEQAREERHEAKLQHLRDTAAMLKAFTAKPTPVTPSKI